MNALFFKLNYSQDSLCQGRTFNFLICIDSLSSLCCLLNVNSTEKLVVDVQSILYYLDCDIHFSYVRSHSGNPGNDRADQLAKEATCQDMNLLMSVSLSYWNHLAWEITVSSWNTEFLSSPKAMWTKRAAGSLVVKASDSRPEGLGSMLVPPNTLRIYTEYVLVKSVGPKVLWDESRVRGQENISLPSSPMVKLWRWRQTTGVLLAPCLYEFRAPCSDYVRQVFDGIQVWRACRSGKDVKSNQAAKGSPCDMQPDIVLPKYCVPKSSI
ncbi:RNase H domain-containing protein [Trichonephila clavipes]|nr:RNase H domain-containing protein [Trichonephila clavipes]